MCCNWKKTFFVPNFSKNLILVFTLLPLRISCNFQDLGFCLLIKSEVIRKGTLCDGVYTEQLLNNYNSLSINTSTRRHIMNGDFFLL